MEETSSKARLDFRSALEMLGSCISTSPRSSCRPSEYSAKEVINAGVSNTVERS